MSLRAADLCHNIGVVVELVVDDCGLGYHGCLFLGLGFNLGAGSICERYMYKSYFHQDAMQFRSNSYEMSFEGNSYDR